MKVEARDGIPTMVGRRMPWRERRRDDLTYIVRVGDTLDSIAHQLLGDGELWWVIADANAIDDLFAPLEPGTVLRIPSRRTVYEEILP